MIIAIPRTSTSYDKHCDPSLKPNTQGINLFVVRHMELELVSILFKVYKDEDIEILIKIKNELYLKIVTELITIE